MISKADKLICQGGAFDSAIRNLKENNFLKNKFSIEKKN